MEHALSILPSLHCSDGESSEVGDQRSENSTIYRIFLIFAPPDSFLHPTRLGTTICRQLSYSFAAPGHFVSTDWISRPSFMRVKCNLLPESAQTDQVHKRTDCSRTSQLPGNRENFSMANPNLSCVAASPKKFLRSPQKCRRDWVDNFFQIDTIHLSMTRGGAAR